MSKARRLIMPPPLCISRYIKKSHCLCLQTVWWLDWITSSRVIVGLRKRSLRAQERCGRFSVFEVCLRSRLGELRTTAAMGTALACQPLRPCRTKVIARAYEICRLRNAAHVNFCRSPLNPRCSSPTYSLSQGRTQPVFINEQETLFPNH